MLSIIAAIGENRELGKEGSLIWKLPSDLKFFKEITMGKTIIMGRNTFESLPGILKGRNHLVISKSLNIDNEKVWVVRNIDQVINEFKDSDEEIFVIGGGKIYEAFINYALKMYLTEIKAKAQADTFFPEFNINDWERQEIIPQKEENGVEYKTLLYTRKNIEKNK